jgi:hypothetical protein
MTNEKQSASTDGRAKAAVDEALRLFVVVLRTKYAEWKGRDIAADIEKMLAPASGVEANDVAD